MKYQLRTIGGILLLLFNIYMMQGNKKEHGTNHTPFITVFLVTLPKKKHK